MDIREKLKKVWNFLVNDDSWASFLADLIIIIIFAKFILYPVIGMTLGTSFPLVAVVSGSMDHQDQDFNTWWNAKESFYLNHNISEEQFHRFYLSDGFKKGDVLVIKGEPPGNFEIGDIIVFHESSRANPIIHRVIAKIDNETYATKGDANSQQLTFEKKIKYSNIEGKAVLMIPKIGWVKVGAVDLLGYLRTLI